MKKYLGKNEASGSSNKSSCIIIVSIIAVTLFIGTTLQPAIASPIPEVVVIEKEDECPLCRSRDRHVKENPGPKCKTCLNAIDFALKHMPGYVADKLRDVDEYYFTLMMDFALWILEGIKEGLKLSGFKIDVDYDELFDNIVYWVDKTVENPGHDITKLIAALHGISKGVRTYLVACCNPNGEENLSDAPLKIWSISNIIRVLYIWIKQLQQLVL